MVVFVFLKLIASNNNDELSIEEINKISNSIAAVQCSIFEVENWGMPVFGSGTYLTLKDSKTNSNINVLLTNSHVAENPQIRNLEDDYGNCSVVFDQNKRYYFFNFFDTTVSNDDFDLALLTVDKGLTVEAEVSPLSNNGNPLSFCKNVATGMKVYIFGYPGNADSYILLPEPKQKDFVNQVDWGVKYIEWIRKMDEYNRSRNLILTEGIISGKSEDGYFTTAKIDTGNSGGVAISKENGEICLVGIPTWVSMGEIENIGIIQPIDNVYKAKINWDRFINRISLPLSE